MKINLQTKRKGYIDKGFFNFLLVTSVEQRKILSPCKN